MFGRKKSWNSALIRGGDERISERNVNARFFLSAQGTLKIPPNRGSRHPQGAFFIGNDVELGSLIFGAADPRPPPPIPRSGRRTELVEAQISTNDEIPKASFNRIVICIHVIILIDLRGDTYKSS